MLSGTQPNTPASRRPTATRATAATAPIRSSSCAANGDRMQAGAIQTSSRGQAWPLERGEKPEFIVRDRFSKDHDAREGIAGWIKSGTCPIQHDPTSWASIVHVLDLLAIPEGLEPSTC